MRTLFVIALMAIFGLASVAFAHESHPDSKVVTLGGDLSREVENGDKPFFVMFFAPWCPHCKQLLPVWDQASIDHSDKATWATVDCTQHEQTCVEYQVQGYPSLKLFNNGAVLEYNGERDVSGFLDFIERANRPPLTITDTKDEFDAFVQDKPSFVAFFGDEAQRNVVEDAARQFHMSTDFVATQDVSFGKEYKVTKSPALVAVNTDSVLTYEGEFEVDAVRKWISRVRLGLLPELGPQSFGELTGSGFRLVIVALDPNADYYQDRIDATREIAKKYLDSFVFAWLDGVRWAQYLEAAYKISADQVPVVVVLDPVKEEYFQSQPDNAEELSEFLDNIIEGSISATSLRQTPHEPEGFEKYKALAEEYIHQYVWYSLGGAFVVGFIFAKILSFGGKAPQPKKKKD